MRISNINTTFGQVHFATRKIKSEIQKELQNSSENFVKHYHYNLSSCENSTQYDIIVNRWGKVFLTDKKENISQEFKGFSSTLENLNNALKTVLMLETQ